MIFNVAVFLPCTGSVLHVRDAGNSEIQSTCDGAFIAKGMKQGHL